MRILFEAAEVAFTPEITAQFPMKKNKNDTVKF